MSRRGLLGGAAAAGLTGVTTSAWSAPSAEAASHSPFREAALSLVLLGTGGGPAAWRGRSGICSAVTVGDRSYLVDLGLGATRQFDHSGISAASVRSIFISHLHSDHIVDLFTMPWLRHGGIGTLVSPVDVYGPGRAGGLPSASGRREVPTINPENPTPGTVDFIEKSIEAGAYDLNIRMRDEHWPDIRSVLRPHDIALPDVGANSSAMWPDMEPFEVFEDDRTRVTATLVQHPPVFPAFAFRFDTEHGSVVLSGDTGISPNLIRLARGADVLAHEVISLDWVRSLNVPDALVKHLEESHTDVNKVGGVAEEAGVSTLVLNHIIPGHIDLVSRGEWRRRAKKGFSGKVVVGTDLKQVTIAQ